MAKKKAVNKKSIPTTSGPQVKRKAKQAAASSNPPAKTSIPQAQSAGIHVYLHEVYDNPNNAPLIVDIPIAAGRGKNLPRPSFVSFTAEMPDEQWPDQFAFRVISLEAASVRVMISRIDKGLPELNWGAKLIVRVLVVDLPGT